MRLLPVWGLVLATGVAGCAAPGQLSTPSGRPEVTIREADPQRVADACVAYCAGRGWEVERADRLIVQACAPAGFGTSLLIGSQYDAQAWNRISFTIAPRARMTTVYGAQSVVGNRGSAFERVTPLNSQSAFDGMQSILVEALSSLDADTAP